MTGKLRSLGWKGRSGFHGLRRSEDLAPPLLLLQYFTNEHYDLCKYTKEKIFTREFLKRDVEGEKEAVE